MKLKGHIGYWRDAVHLGPFISWQDRDIWRRVFTIGFSFGPWDFELEISLWSVEESVKMLKARGMTEREAWEFCDSVRGELPDPYDSRVNMRKEIEKAFKEC